MIISFSLIILVLSNVLSLAFGLLFRTAQTKKKSKRITELEIEMLKCHQEILDLHSAHNNSKDRRGLVRRA